MKRPRPLLMSVIKKVLPDRRIRQQVIDIYKQNELVAAIFRGEFDHGSAAELIENKKNKKNSRQK